MLRLEGNAAIGQPSARLLASFQASYEGGDGNDLTLHEHTRRIKA
jgi:hypothetical protein